MPAFDIVVVGSGGGLDETNLSGYLVKPSNQSWDDGIIALEAGSGHGALKHIMKRNPDIFGEPSADENPSKKRTPFEIYANVKCFLLTHAHLDHISSLVMSAGTLGGSSKRIYGSPQTLKDLEGIFADRVWPRLATYDETNRSFRLFYHALYADGKYKTVFPDVAVRTMTISHGKNDSGPYECACFFIKHLPTQHEFLFFGDVEPDSVAVKPRNITVWRAAAPKIPHDLSAVFIECSYLAGRPTEALWGHLSPEHLVQEMITLATEVVLARQALQVGGMGKAKAKAKAGVSASASGLRPRKKQKRDPVPAEALHGVLTGLRVYIMHCKEHFSTDRPISHVIGDQCREMLAPHKLGLELLTADQGMKMVV
ncbi:cyclic-AMP phosphodiesterase [Boletus reticuloceps]|uniref:Cyclic-AMP phosphodiesterase n=1 Tax=Boletus reticuloceps TaxID=495285 RepID=A0A8I2YVB5_9AGAM|nr:cyclic-AMP phosphodiesterase [Boletus reticuloceps]